MSALESRGSTAETQCPILELPNIVASPSSMLVVVLVHRTNMRSVFSLHSLSERLVTASSVVPSPSPASTRIAHRPFLALIQSRWNEELASAFSAVTRWERHASEWGRKMLYGERP